MDILEELRQLQQRNAKPEPQQPTTNDSFISNAVVESALFSAGVEIDVIKDVLLEPVESRLDWILYFEDRNK